MSCFVNCTKESIPRPGMVLFDYGDTLARESAPDFPRGWRAVFKYVRAKPEDVGPKEAYELADSLWRRFSHFPKPFRRQERRLGNTRMAAA